MKQQEEKHISQLVHPLSKQPCQCDAQAGEGGSNNIQIKQNPRKQQQPQTTHTETTNKKKQNWKEGNVFFFPAFSSYSELW